jgi:CheY-like chemotaxis protein
LGEVLLRGKSRPEAGLEATVALVLHADPTASNKAVLVVEDDRVLLGVLARGLATLGYKTYAAVSGVEALEVNESERVDLLLSDVVLGRGLTGLQLADAFKTRQPALSVLLTSGYDRYQLSLLGIELGNSSFLMKPYGLHDLELAVAVSLARFPQP